MNLRLIFALLLTASSFSSTISINLSSKPLDLLFRLCLGKVGNEAIGQCLQDHIRQGLEVIRPLMRAGVPVGPGEHVVLDPLVIDPVVDGTDDPPKWKVSGMKVTGLSGINVDRIQVTESTVELEMSLGMLTAEATLDLWFLSVRPRVQFQIRSPRFLVTADWAYRGGALVISNSEKIIFFNNGYAVTLNSVDVPQEAVSSLTGGGGRG